MKSRTKIITVMLLLITVCATALTVWWFLGHQEPLPEGLRILWDSLLNLTLLGGVIFDIGLWRFRKQFN